MSRSRVALGFSMALIEMLGSSADASRNTASGNVSHQNRWRRIRGSNAKQIVFSRLAALEHAYDTKIDHLAESAARKTHLPKPLLAHMLRAATLSAIAVGINLAIGSFDFAMAEAKKNAHHMSETISLGQALSKDPYTVGYEKGTLPTDLADNKTFVHQFEQQIRQFPKINDLAVVQDKVASITSLFNLFRLLPEPTLSVPEAYKHHFANVNMTSDSAASITATYGALENLFNGKPFDDHLHGKAAIETLIRRLFEGGQEVRHELERILTHRLDKL